MKVVHSFAARTRLRKQSYVPEVRFLICVCVQFYSVAHCNKLAKFLSEFVQDSYLQNRWRHRCLVLLFLELSNPQALEMHVYCIYWCLKT